ncbi:MAG: glycosyltransferase [Nitrospirae bacterium]|nr:glycosyltransferase [Nitrospirota bacterium]
MTQQTYKIAVLSVGQEVSDNRYSFLKALFMLGNKIRKIGVYNEAAMENLIEYNPDFMMVFCMDYKKMYADGKDSFLSCFPYATIWDSNPLGALCFLKNHKENHISLLMIDSKVVTDLKSLGFEQAVYFPYYYADQEIFKPLSPTEQYSHDVSFAGRFFNPLKISTIFTGTVEWSDGMKLLRKEFNEKRMEENWYVDVFEYLNGKMDIWGRECEELSYYLMFLQKFIERIQLFKTISSAGIALHVYGKENASHFDDEFNKMLRVACSHVYFHDTIDKHTELPKLYNSTKINPCCTQFPRACHERVFQTAACGAFILHEYKEDVPDLFEPGKEIIMYKSLDELPDLIKYYLKHEDERNK